jgi:hypothetical protein
VDRLAGLTVALEEAKRRSGLPDRTSVHVISLPVEKGGILQQLRPAADPIAAKASILPAPLRKVLDALPPLLFEPRMPLVRFPWAEVVVPGTLAR